MSQANRRRYFRALANALLLLVMCAAPACWEQWSEAWYPQMKWQKAQQAFERIQFKKCADCEPQVDPFTPPPGAVAVDAEAPAVQQYDPAADALQNPFPRGDFESLARGKQQYAVYCETCHGATGLGDGPVSAAGKKRGPLVGVFPLVTAAGRSDGYIYNLIRAGGIRMPDYRRIPREDRWHLVNYVRYLQQPPAPPPPANPPPQPAATESAAAQPGSQP